MGTTIRRQPISFPIPASPDYKFLNITDFGGLNISSNPFVVSSNTASDCLNVYVDEDNALSTRPRLQLKYDLMSLAGLDDRYELIDIYNLHNGYLLHVKKGSTGYMYRFEESNGVLMSPVAITGETKPIKKCKIFEQNDLIFLLDGDSYKYISTRNSISDVTGFIPTAIVGSTNKTSGKKFESLNLLSDKYNETFFWDGTWNPEDVKRDAADIIKNEYVELNQTSVTNNNYYPIKIYKDDTVIDSNYLSLLLKNINDTSQLFNLPIELNSNDSADYGISLGKPADGPTNPYDITGNVSDDGKVLVYYYLGGREGVTDTTKHGLYVYRKDSNTWSYLFDSTQSETGDLCYSHGQDKRRVFVNSTGSVIIACTETNIIKAIYNGTTYDITKIALPDNSQCLDTQASEDGSVIVCLLDTSSSGVSSLGADTLFVVKGSNTSTLKGTEKQYASYAVSKDGNHFILTESDSQSAKLYNTFLMNDDYEILTNLGTNPSQAIFAFSDDNARLYFSSKWKSGWINVATKTVIPVEFDSGKSNQTAWFTTYQDKYLLLPYTDDYDTYYYKKLKLNLENPEPLITVTRTLQSTDEDYKTHGKVKNTFKKSQLIERFDNNMWFASNNYTFHTLYNDPTYIPLTSYNDLGENFEEITGLSIVNDNVLAAYKRNRIYIITPVVVGNEETYAYTETKNVVGNDVPDAPILTILTEMPTIVSYDGIFALNQLENVQSSDRITTLISENINPRWLKESSEDIDNCKTLNRLYWTYYILPHKRTGDENKDYTKIYLLDNRTQQWYYWELPIYVINAMVKDNKTHFIHENGTVFTLEITDLIHEYNPDVTEYYDKVDDEKLIIPWHWISQILSLSTINYSKKLVDTTFILTDTDTQDEYGLDYSFKAWRKSVSETNATTITNNIHYVQSTTKRTMIPRFNFIQLRLSNTEDDLDNNKLRLVGLGLKYVLLEGLY